MHSIIYYYIDMNYQYIQVIVYKNSYILQHYSALLFDYIFHLFYRFLHIDFHDPAIPILNR